MSDYIIAFSVLAGLMGAMFAIFGAWATRKMKKITEEAIRTQQEIAERRAKATVPIPNDVQRPAQEAMREAMLTFDGHFKEVQEQFAKAGQVIRTTREKANRGIRQTSGQTL